MTIGERFYVYDNIPLSLYFTIAETQDYQKLVRVGVATDSECYKIWESILKKSSQATNSLDFLHHFEALKRYASLIAEFNVIKSCLLKICIEIDWTAIKFLQLNGYKIVTTGATKEARTLAYAQSIQEAFSKSNNILTKIETKRKELEKLAKANSKTEAIGIEQALARLGSALDNTYIPSDVTLARYNELKKIAKEKIKAQNKNGRR